MKEEEIIKLTNDYLFKCADTIKRDYFWVNVPEYKVKSVLQMGNDNHPPLFVCPVVVIGAPNHPDITMEVQISKLSKKVIHVFPRIAESID